MSDALSDIAREEERAKIVAKSLWEIAKQMWYYAKKRPSGKIREAFVTDMLESISYSLVTKMEDLERSEKEDINRKPATYGEV
jgi:hypothetical protein